MSEPKKHHFLPQSYLERFLDEDSQSKLPHIHVSTKAKRPIGFVAAIHDTAVVADYNTIDFKDTPPDRVNIEQALSKAEASHKLLLDRILTEGEISRDDKGELSFFIALTHMRVPKFKRIIEQSLRSAVLATGDWMLEQGRLPPLPEGLRKYKGMRFRDFISIDIYNWIILKYMYDTSISSGFAHTLQLMNFHLLKASTDSVFITGDSPVCIFHPHYERIKPLGVSPRHPEAELTIPLSPTTLLLLINEDRDIRRELGAQDVEEYNRRTIVMADRYVYSSKDFGSLNDLISANANRSAGFVFGEAKGAGGSYMITRFLPVRP